MCLANGPRFLEAEISRSVVHWLAHPETVAEIGGFWRRISRRADET
jgi:hypothetical protein